MENQRSTQSSRFLELIFSVGVLAILLLLAVYTEELLQRELCKSLAVVACLNLVRVTINNNISTEK